MRKPADYTLYKYRYILSYFCIAVLLVAVLWIGVLYTPGGLREQEIKSVSQASMLSRQTLEPSMVVNLPYYLLQRRLAHHQGGGQAQRPDRQSRKDRVPHGDMVSSAIDGSLIENLLTPNTKIDSHCSR